jgi:carboxylesterase type B
LEKPFMPNQWQSPSRKFAEEIGATSLEKLRALPAQQLLDAVMKGNPFRFGPNVDGYFLPAAPAELYAKGEQAHVPLLAGWNRDEGSYQQFFEKEAPTKENYVSKVSEQFGDQAPEILKLFPLNTDEQVKQSAGRLSTADFIAFGTWRWIEMQNKTGDAAEYRYQFDQALPVDPGSPEVNMAYTRRKSSTCSARSIRRSWRGVPRTTRCQRRWAPIGRILPRPGTRMVQDYRSGQSTNSRINFR